MSEFASAWTRLVAFVVGLLAAAALIGYLVYTRSTEADATAAREDSQILVQIQEQLTGMEMRLELLENRPRAQAAKGPSSEKAPEATAPADHSTARPARPHFQILPESALQIPPQPAQPRQLDPAAEQKLAQLQQGIGDLQEQTTSNREAWQANTDRLAEVAGEVGAEHGQIIQTRDELNRFLGQTAHSSFSFELRRGDTPAPVGPVRIALKASNQKSQKYTVCVYMRESCVQVKDRFQYEVVELAVSPDTAPFELIATKVDKDGIVGYLEVPVQNSGH